MTLIGIRRAERWLQEWDTLEKASTNIYSALPKDTKPAFFQLVHHPVSASANVARLVSVLISGRVVSLMALFTISS